MCCPDKTSGGGTSSASSGSNQRGRAPRDHELETFGNGGFHGNSQAEKVLETQQQTMEDQDAGLDMLYESVLRQKEISHAIGDELDVQSGLLDDLENAMDNTGNSLNRQQSRVEQLMETAKSSGSTWLIVALSITLVILTMLVFNII